MKIKYIIEIISSKQDTNSKPLLFNELKPLLSPPTTHAEFANWIDAAIDDLERCEQADNIEIDMASWCVISQNTPCRVCLAGAVIISRLVTNEHSISDSTYELGPENFKEYTDVLEALDLVRTGNLISALTTLNLSSTDLKNFDIPSYSFRRKKFKALLRQTANQLREQAV